MSEKTRLAIEHEIEEARIRLGRCPGCGKLWPKCLCGKPSPSSPTLPAGPVLPMGMRP